MFESRRRRFLDALGPDAVAILRGARLVPRSADTHFAFRQNSDFHYLTGFDHPDAVAVFRSDPEPRYLLFVQPREPDAEVWTGPRPGVEGAVERYGADAAHPIGEILQRVPELLEGARRLYLVLGQDPELDRRVIDTLEAMRLRSRAGAVPPDAVRDPRAILHEMRLVKEPEELEVMRRAAAITRDAHHEAARRAHPGAREFELEAVIDYTFRRHGATGPAYDSIVGSGAHATVLHYTTNDGTLGEGELVLIDAGCELEGYASDVTRTYPVGGRFQGASRALYEVVREAQEAALAAVAPAATLDAIHDVAVRRLSEGLVDLGLVEGPVDACLEGQKFRRYYMHRTSHWLGLDVHDVGSYVRDGKPRPLEPGMVFTVEPGLYVPPDDPSHDPRFRGIGVRIEDDVLVTASGSENLTRDIPKKVEDVEAWVRDA